MPDLASNGIASNGISNGFTRKPSDAVIKARDYYDSIDADEFYYQIWGGEDIHVGLYESEHEPIYPASRRTVDRLATKIEPITPSMVGIDLGSGYGGGCRYHVDKYGCRMISVNVSATENARHRVINEQRGISDDQIHILEGCFTHLDVADNSCDFAWSQDALMHCDNREQVLREVYRVLKPGGKFVFTDPMQASPNESKELLQPIYDRLHLESLACPQRYREWADKIGLKVVEFEDLTHQLSNHYRRVHEETEKNEDALLKKGVSTEYLTKMKHGLKLWVKGGNARYLSWGIMVMQKPL